MKGRCTASWVITPKLPGWRQAQDASVFQLHHALLIAGYLVWRRGGHAGDGQGLSAPGNGVFIQPSERPFSGRHALNPRAHSLPTDKCSDPI